MMRGRSGGRKGIIGTIFGLLFSAVIIGAISAFFRLNGINSIDTFVSYFAGQQDNVKQCYINHGKNCTAKITDDGKAALTDSATNVAKDPVKAILSNSALGYTGPAKGQPFMDDEIKRTKDSMIDKVDGLKTKTKDTVAKAKYSETDWPHFVPTSRTCWSMQNEILTRQAVPGSIKLLDEYRKSTTDTNAACSIKSGQWTDAYTGKVIKSSKKVALDYVVSLKYAHNNGGYKWSKEQKQAFANDAENLSTVTSSSKKDRAGKSPSEWLPKSDKEACVFSKNYANILSKYSLSISDKDKTAISRGIMKCTK